MRILRFLHYLIYLTWHIIKGSWQIVRSTWLSRGSRSTPAIVELELRCDSDIEVTLFASSITITPGTLVLGVAAAQSDDDHPTLFVHSLFDNDKESVCQDLRELETYVLNALRKEAVS